MVITLPGNMPPTLQVHYKPCKKSKQIICRYGAIHQFSQDIAMQLMNAHLDTVIREKAGVTITEHHRDRIQTFAC